MEIARMVFKVLTYLLPLVEDFVEKAATGQDVSDHDVRKLLPSKYRNEIDAEIKTAWRKDHGLPT